MLNNKKTVVGLSGGVDSALCALLLKEQGYDVTGVFLDIGLGGGEDAEKVAENLKIPFEIVDIRDALEQHVARPFVDAYLSGKTPNPCVACNPNVKFPALLAAADRLGANSIATGHYAEIGYNAKTGRHLLLSGKEENDQSYMLCRLTQDILSRLMFPLGGYCKAEVRRKAVENEISVAGKPDSMEICFIPGGNYAAYIESRGKVPPAGDFVDGTGQLLGRHRGIHHYTLGQRRGLGIAAGKRVFVSGIDPIKNQVTLSDEDMLLTETAFAGQMNWIAVCGLTGEMRAEVRVRHSKRSYPARIMPDDGGRVLICFDEPVRAPTPGQAAVFYEGRTVLGGGYIEGAVQ